jgi:hypothetical protein
MPTYAPGSANQPDRRDPARAEHHTHRYAVIAASSGWRVVSGRRQIGQFACRADALAVAVNLTKQALAEGHDAELLAQPMDGDFSLRPLFATEPAPETRPGVDEPA